MYSLENRPSTVSFLASGIICFLVLSVIYLFFGPPSYEDVDLVNMILYLLLMPLILIPGTIVVCVIAGSPLRIIPGFYRWWYQRPYIPFLGLIIGMILCFLSRTPGFMETDIILIDDEKIDQQVPNFSILSTGWFLTAFSILHLYLESVPDFIMKKN